jgi:hypothetical protein
VLAAEIGGLDGCPTSPPIVLGLLARATPTVLPGTRRVGLYRLAPAAVLLLAVLTIGAVHFFYDAFIWKLRKREVAASLVVASSSAALLTAQRPA